MKKTFFYVFNFRCSLFHGKGVNFLVWNQNRAAPDFSRYTMLGRNQKPIWPIAPIKYTKTNNKKNASRIEYLYMWSAYSLTLSLSLMLSALRTFACIAQMIERKNRTENVSSVRCWDPYVCWCGAIGKARTRRNSFRVGKTWTAFKLSGKIYCLSCSMAACLCAPIRHLFVGTRTHTGDSALTTGERRALPHNTTTIFGNEENWRREKIYRSGETKCEREKENKRSPTLWVIAFVQKYLTKR